MPVKIGSLDLTKAYVGSTPIKALYAGATQIWSAAPPPTYGPDQTTYTTQVPDSTGTGSSFAYGNDVVFAVAGRIASVRYYWVAAGANASRTVRIYSSGQADLGSAAVLRGTAGSVGWATAALAAPITVTAGQTVRVVAEMPTSDTWGRVNQPGADVVNGDLTRKMQGYSTSGGTGYPNSPVGRHYFADIVFQKQTG